MPNVTVAGPITNSAKYDKVAEDSTNLQRALARVRYEPSGCWIWTGASNDRGYPVMVIDSVTLYAHRVTYRIVRGPIAEGLTIDHLCRVPACINPMHLEQVTNAVNIARGDGNGRKKVCSKGHPYEGPNLRMWTDKRGYTRRYCVQCTNDRNLAWRKSH